MQLQRIKAEAHHFPHSFGRVAAVLELGVDDIADLADVVREIDPRKPAGADHLLFLTVKDDRPVIAFARLVLADDKGEIILGEFNIRVRTPQ